MDNLVKIYSTCDELEMQLITNLLDINGIHYILEDEGSGQYLRLYMGTSMLNKSILVHEENATKAIEIINNAKFQSPKEDISKVENNPSKEYSLHSKTSKSLTKIISIFIIALFITPFIATIISWIK